MNSPIILLGGLILWSESHFIIKIGNKVKTLYAIAWKKVLNEPYGRHAIFIFIIIMFIT